MKVLIVDDQKVNRTLPSALLRQAGCDVFELETGEEVLPFLNLHQVDAILLDISMPGISGTAVCRLLRRESRFDGVHVVAYTAHALLSERDEILAAGFNEMLLKPINRQRLYAALGLPAD